MRLVLIWVLHLEFCFGGLRTVTLFRRLTIFVCVGALSLVLGLPHAFALPRLLVDTATGEVLYAEEEGRPWHPASLTKLMTALVAFEAISNGRVTLDTPVIMSATARKAPPSKVGFPLDMGVRLEDALYLLIVKSANDIAIAIAETISGDVSSFANEMNRTAQALGMTATHYENPHGLHNALQKTSARDLAILALTIRQRHPQFADMFATQTVTLGESKLSSHNNLLIKFEGTTGMKTGFVCASGLNIVATAERNGRSLMAVVLGGASARERGELTAELMLKGFSQELPGTGWRVADLSNSINDLPFNMRPFICGEESKAFVAERAAVFSYGLEGQPSYLTDQILGREYRAHTLGKIRNVPLPRSRPLWAPEAVAVTPEVLVSPVPLPRPRPFLRAGL